MILCLRLLAALWWGSLTSLGVLVVPVLFVHMPSPAMAGSVAAHLFSAQSVLSMVCGVIVLLAQRISNARVGRSLGLPLGVLGGLFFAALLEWVAAPRIAERDSLAFWHALGSAFFALQWVCVSAHIWKISRPQADRSLL